MKKLFLIFFVIIFTYTLNAEKLKIAVGLSVPPYVIKKNDSGLQIDIIREVLASKHHFIENLIYASNKRMTILLEDRLVDAALNIPHTMPNVYYSDSIIEFDNVAITLKERDIKINTVFDLHYKRVMGFQNANRLMGKAFSEYTMNNPLYDETVHQSSQVKNLVQKRIDVVIADKHIFNYYYNQLYDEFEKPVQFNYFPIFKPSPRYMGFSSEKIRDDFNEGLKEFKLSPEYKKLLIQYGFKDE